MKARAPSVPFSLRLFEDARLFDANLFEVASKVGPARDEALTGKERPLDVDGSPGISGQPIEGGSFDVAIPVASEAFKPDETSGAADQPPEAFDAIVELPETAKADTSFALAAARPATVTSGFDNSAIIPPGADTDIPDVQELELVEHHHACMCLACSTERDESIEGNSPGTAGEGSGNIGVLSEMADFLMTGYWNTGYGDGTRSHNVTNSGTDANNGVLHYNLSGYFEDEDGVTAERANLIREAFKIFESTLGIQFEETTSTNTSTVDFFFRDNASGAYASHSYSNSGAWGSTITYAQINVAASWSGATSTYDDYTFQTILHEIGHAIGLGHQGSYNGNAVYGTDNTFDNDSWQTTMMSYFSQTQATAVDASYEFLQTPMVADWLALDELYGRQGFGVSNAYTENTTWGFNTTVTSDVSDVWATWSDWANRTASTIVDGGGTDTLDLSGYSNNTLINLAPSDPGGTAPSSSDIGGRIGNLTIAAGTIIENAIGGAGSETFYGNAADNILTGNGGDDTFHDSLGSDTYVGGAGNDYVIFGATFAEYTYALLDGVLQVIDAATDWINNTIEWLTFSDQTLSWQAVVDSIAAEENSVPVGVEDAYTVNEDAVLSGSGLLDNDTDADADTLSVATVEGVSVIDGGTTVTLESGATVLMLADGTFEYDQNGAFDALDVGQQATDSFVYSVSDGSETSADTVVTITINGTFDNTGPVANPDSFELVEDGTVSGTVLTNDTDANDDALSVIALNGSSAGLGTAYTLLSGARVTLNSDGTFDYDTNGSFADLEDGQVATDNFSYTISDGRGGTDTANVTMTINGVSTPVAPNNVLISFEWDAPGAYGGDHGLIFSGLTVASSDALSGSRAGSSGSDGDFTITASDEDFDLNSLSVLNQSGRQNVTFEAYDDGALVGSVLVTLEERHASTVELGSAFESVDQIVVKGGSDFLVDDLSILTRIPMDADGNFAPVAVNDALSTDEASSVTGNLLANDNDANDDALALLSINGNDTGSVTLDSGATVTFLANGDITYDPNGAFDDLYKGQTATDFFTYVMSDGRGGLTEASVSVNVAGQGVVPTEAIAYFDTAQQTTASTVSDDGFVFLDARLTTGGPGVTSGSVALSSVGGSVSVVRADGDMFAFEGGDFTVGGQGQEVLTLEGYVDGVLVGTEEFDLRANRDISVNPTNGIFDAIDELVISTAIRVTMDDIDFL